MHRQLRHHLLAVERLSRQAQLAPQAPSALEPFVVALSAISHAVRSSLSSRPARARRLIRLTLPAVASLLQQPYVLEPRFTSLSQLLLRELLFFYAHAHAHYDHLVIPAVARIAARMRPPTLLTLCASLLHIAAASRSASLVPPLLRATPRHHRFIQVLQATVCHGERSDIDRHLRPATCIYLLNTVSAACSLQCFNSAPHHAPFVRALLRVFESRRVTHTTDNARCPSLFFLAVCAALLRFTITSAPVSTRSLSASLTLRTLIIQFIHQALHAYQQPISTLAHDHHQITFLHRPHTATISLILIISSISSIAVKHLSSTHVQLLRDAVQTCMRTSLCGQIPNPTATATDATFHTQLCRSISHNSSTLATAYAHFVQQLRSFQTSVHFLTTLISAAPPSQSLSRFVSTVIANTNVSSDVAVAYVSTLSLLTAHKPLLQPDVAHRLSLLIVRDHDATLALVQLICAVLVNRTCTTDTNHRLVFLFRFLSLVLATRTADATSTHPSAHVPDEREERLWLTFANEVVSLLDSDPTSESILSASTECVSQLVKQEHEATKLATQYLRESLTRAMIERYLFLDMPTTMRKRLVHVVLFLDAITTTSKDGHIFGSFLATLIESAERVGAKADRMLGILLLRCLTRCDEKVVSVALDKMTSFIGTNRDRKETFLPLVRAAVLGLDTAKKDVCVVWMMRLFGDMSQLQSQTTRPTAAITTNLRTAKL